MISTPFMAENGEQQPSGPPEYKVFRQRRGILGRLRKPGRPRPRRRCATALRGAGVPGTAANAASRRTGRAAGGRSNGSGWRARLDRAQLPRLRRLCPAAVVQALRRGEVGTARQPVPAGRCADDPRPRHRRQAAGHQGARGGPLAEVLRAAGARRRAPRRLLAGAVPRRHPDADPGRAAAAFANSRSRATPMPRSPASPRRRSMAPTPTAEPSCRSKRSSSSSESTSTTSRSSTSPASKT